MYSIVRLFQPQLPFAATRCHLLPFAAIPFKKSSIQHSAVQRQRPWLSALLLPLSFLTSTCFSSHLPYLRMHPHRMDK